MKKRIMNIHVEFFKNQDPKHIEDMLRNSVSFPAFSRITVCVDHRGLRAGKKEKTDVYKNIPLLVRKDESDIR